MDDAIGHVDFGIYAVGNVGEHLSDNMKIKLSNKNK